MYVEWVDEIFHTHGVRQVKGRHLSRSISDLWQLATNTKLEPISHKRPVAKQCYSGPSFLCHEEDVFGEGG